MTGPNGRSGSRRYGIAARRSRKFIRSIREILDASDHDPDLAAIDVMELLHEVEERTLRLHPTATIRVSGPGSAYILAGDLIDRAFQNLVDHAVQHNNGPVTIEIAVEGTDDIVIVKIADDGSGLENLQYDGIFEPPESGDHGYGRFLANNLAEVYGGRLRLERTGPDGTVFVLQFSEVSPPEQSSSFLASR